jgi:uncharacterized protein
MRLLAEFSHPAQVHKFKHVFRGLIDKGHQVLVLSRDKDVMLDLLEAEGIPHICISRARTGLVGLALELLQREARTLWHSIRFRPDIVLSAHSVSVTHSGWLLRVPRVVHDDTEHAKLQQSLYMPFASHIVTSSVYQKDLGIRQIRLESLEPLAYLHPDHFTPDPSVRAEYGLGGNARYAVVRFVAWNAAHDVGLHANARNVREALIEHILECGVEKVVLSSEAQFGHDDDRIVRIRPDHLHHIIAGAILCVSEGGSVANESAVLGVPTVYANPLQAGLSDELVRLELTRKVDSLEEAFDVVTTLLENPSTQADWAKAREQMLNVKSNMARALEELLIRVDRGET